MKFVQVNRPAPQASWVEHFYTGSLQVVNGRTETDNPTWIEQLRQRGYEEVQESVGEKFPEETPESSSASDEADEVSEEETDDNEKEQNDGSK